ncbi:hypothetical protein, partial [Helicobacter vulpis]|uniref:hypothetical protein n=1 Tax=Helicobacter vulpis TaxID=2316076 RepID=UPI000EB1F4C9
MDMLSQQQVISQQIKALQTLIETETDYTIKQVLEQKQADYVNKLVELTTQSTTPQLPNSTQDQTTATNTLEQQPTPLTTTQPITQDQPTDQQPIKAEVIAQDTHTIPTAIAEKYVTFHNDVNSVSLGRLSALEANLLFAIF